MHWSSRFVGIPYADRGRTRAGSDCWGLVRIVHAEMLGFDIPAYEDAYSSCDEIREVDALVERAAASPLWRKVNAPGEFDVLIFRTGRYATHAGIHVSKGLMLHMVEEACAKMQRYDAAPWDKRLTGIFRWHQR